MEQLGCRGSHMHRLTGSTAAFLLFFLFLMASPHAIPLFVQADEIAGELDVRVEIPSQLRPEVSPLTVNVTATVDSGQPLSIYLASWDDEDKEWQIIDWVADVDAGRNEVNVTFDVVYSGETSEKEELGLIGVSASEGYYLYRFSIDLDWSIYRKALERGIRTLTFEVIPLLAIIAALGAVVFYVAVRMRHEGQPEEYTWRTFISPILRGTLVEKLSQLFVAPLFWVVELFLAAGLIVTIALYALAGISPFGLEVLFISAVIAFAAPTVYVVAVWLFDVYEREPFRIPAAMFIWGMCAAAIAFVLNVIATIVASLAFVPFLGFEALVVVSFVTAVFIAPVVEELSKGAGTFLASYHYEMDDIFDGLLYGFTAGVGFAAIENLLYFAANATPALLGVEGWVGLMLYRSVFSVLSHGALAAIVGGAFGLAKQTGGSRIIALPALAVAMIIHGGLNMLAHIEGDVVYVSGVPVSIFHPVASGILIIALAVAFFVSSRRKP